MAVSEIASAADTTTSDMAVTANTTTVSNSSQSTHSAVDVAILAQRLRQLEYRLLARDTNTGLAPLADEAPEPAKVIVNTGLLMSTDEDVHASNKEEHEQSDEKADNAETATSDDATAKDLVARLVAVRKHIKSQLEHRQAIVDLWKRYEICRPLLTEPIANNVSEDNADSEEVKREVKMQFENSALSLDARIQLLMETSDDWMRTVALLEEASTKQVCISPSEFQHISALIPQLKSVSTANGALIEQSKQLDGRLDQLLAEYNDTIHTLSQLFLHWNQMLDDLETRVCIAERRA
ncbi:hypothetical protein BDF22DRAFT_743400 [Syncephalis plumigaleata]|nr:hypothetical protein BDF22DRAFT_743400 [Syncephalis plumigaleata]